MTRNYIEDKIQKAAVAYLRGYRIHKRKKYYTTIPFPELLCWHTANQGRSAAEGAKMKEMGVLAGVWDITCIFSIAPGKGILEAKTSKGTLSGPQMDFERRFKERGGVSGIFRSVAECRDILISWGLKCENMTVFEPDLSTWEDKLQWHEEIYGVRDNESTVSNGGTEQITGGPTFKF